MVEFCLPQFGMGTADGTIARWYKSEGDVIAEGEALVEIEAAKTTVEVASPSSGKLHILVAEGENVPVKTPIAMIDAVAEPLTAVSPAGEIMPNELVGKAALREEAGIAPGVPATLESPAATPAPGAEATPVLTATTTPLARRVAASQGLAVDSIAGTGPGGKVLRSDVIGAKLQVEPRAVKAAASLGMKIETGAGTVPMGRVIVEDVLDQAEQARAAPPVPSATAETAATAAPAPKPLPAPSAPAAVPSCAAAPRYREVSHSMMRRTIARRLTESKQQVPHFYLKTSCEIDGLLALRKQLNDGSKGAKLSVNDFVVRAVALAMLEVPDANVSWSEKTMSHHDAVDVAVAVATPRGLITPIVRNADQLPIRVLSTAIKDLSARGKEGKLAAEEYQGGNVSVSNLGMFGVEEFQAIINPPQSCIFAIGAGEQRPVVRNGGLVVRTMMTCTMSVDHRAVDGAVGATLLAAFKSLIEAPALIIA